MSQTSWLRDSSGRKANLARHSWDGWDAAHLATCFGWVEKCLYVYLAKLCLSLPLRRPSDQACLPLTEGRDTCRHIALPYTIHVKRRKTITKAIYFNTFTLASLIQRPGCSPLSPPEQPNPSEFWHVPALTFVLLALQLLSLFKPNIVFSIYVEDLFCEGARL